MNAVARGGDTVLVESRPHWRLPLEEIVRAAVAVIYRGPCNGDWRRRGCDLDNGFDGRLAPSELASTLAEKGRKRGHDHPLWRVSQHVNKRGDKRRPARVAISNASAAIRSTELDIMWLIGITAEQAAG